MNYTVSAKTAQFLKDAGFPQDTHFWWISTSYRITKQGKRINSYTRIGDIREHHRCASLEDNLAAPIAEELFARIRPFRKDNAIYTPTFITDHTLQDDTPIPIYVGWFTPEPDTNGMPTFRNTSLAEVAAESWLYLRKQMII